MQNFNQLISEVEELLSLAGYSLEQIEQIELNAYIVADYLGDGSCENFILALDRLIAFDIMMVVAELN
jgi:hypothetical protein